MDNQPRPCVVLSDYPIKSMAYHRFLNGLGETSVESFRTLDTRFAKVANAKLVICDMNVMEQFENALLEKLERSFPQANILFLQEDHSDMQVSFSNQRDICCLGKLAELHVIQSTLKELLLQSNRSRRKLRGVSPERFQRA